MAKSCAIDKHVYEQVLNLLNSQHFVDARGDESDMLLLSEDEWLADTVVIDNIYPRRGQWEIHLLFAHHQQPLKLIKRKITTCFDYRKAAITAALMRRGAAKDQRGTLRIAVEKFGLCHS